jgi:two-component system nitrate/nitrite response regulator NarL
MSSRSVPTTIIGPKGLLRDSLASLLDGYSYRVTDCYECAASMSRPPEEEGARIVLLTVRSMELAIGEATRVRQICANCKIVALLEDILGDDLERLAHSAIDGYVPLHVSQEVLTRTLDLVTSDSARIVVLADDPRMSTRAAVAGEHKSEHKFEQRSEPGLTPGGDNAPPQPEKTSKMDADHDEPLVSKTVPPGSVPPGRVPRACSVSKTISVSKPIIAIAKSDDNTIPALSVREKQIIDGLVKGQPNKTIARICGITEATVKVHMKAILRKVPCSNRTQVAIWAIEHADFFRNHRMEGPAPSMAE